MIIYQVTVTEGGNFDEVLFDALYRDKAKAESVAAQELAQRMTQGADVVADISPRRVR